jgi:hypothetical protein
LHTEEFDMAEEKRGLRGFRELVDSGRVTPRSVTSEERARIEAAQRDVEFGRAEAQKAEESEADRWRTLEERTSHARTSLDWAKKRIKRSHHNAAAGALEKIENLDRVLMESLQPEARKMEPQYYLAAGQEMRELTQSLYPLRRERRDDIARAIGNLHAAADALDLLGGRQGAEERERRRSRVRGGDVFEDFGSGWAL